MRDVLRKYALETPVDRYVVLVIDETGLLKQGRFPYGVGWQYTGSAGKITNRQVGMFAAYVSQHGHVSSDRQLNIPKAWTHKPMRLAASRVPYGVAFATKPHIAVQMIGRAIASGVPFATVAVDSIYGVGEIGMMLRRECNRTLRQV